MSIDSQKITIDIPQKNDTATVSVESLSKSENEKYRNFLGGIYILTASVATLYHKFGLPGVRALDMQHKLSPFDANLLHNFLDNIGNVRNSFLGAGILTSATDFMLAEAAELTTDKKAHEILISVRKWFPFALMTMLVLSNIDTETVQILPLSFGTPQLSDVPAGLFGILAGSLFFEMWRKYGMSRAFPEQAEELGDMPQTSV